MHHFIPSYPILQLVCGIGVVLTICTYIHIHVAIHVWLVSARLQRRCESKMAEIIVEVSKISGLNFGSKFSVTIIMTGVNKRAVSSGPRELVDFNP